ncbi:hypothetical protein ACYULU_13705 [Breznakiellaceae bacterium SP9]
MVTVTNAQVTEEDNNGNIINSTRNEAVTTPYATSIGSLTSGKLTITLDATLLATETPRSIASINNEPYSELFGRTDTSGTLMTISDSSANIAIFTGFMAGSSELSRFASDSNGSKYVYSSIAYVYVDRGLTLTRSATTERANDGSITTTSNYTPINLTLATGWNLVQMDITGRLTSSDTATETFTCKIATKNVPWLLD